MKLVLAFEGPLDVDATLARFRLWGEDPANRLRPGVFRRVLRAPGRLVPYAVRWDGPVDAARLEVVAPGDDPDVAAAVTAEARRVFGLDFDLAGFYRMAKGDRVLGGLVEPLHGLRPSLAPTPLEMLIGAIAAQQVNLAFAFACRVRLVRRFGTPLMVAGAPLWAFPEPAVLARARLSALRALKFSTRKAEYIRDLARAMTAGALDLEALAAEPNAAVVDRLTAQRGFGRWTAEWFLARCIGRGDVCPAGDLGVAKAFAHYYGRGRRLSEAAIRRRARAWGPYQNLAVHYLLAGMRLGAPAAGGGD